MDAARTAEAERLDALRRRLYSPDVTEEDRAAFRAADARAVSRRPAATDGGPPRRPSRRVRAGFAAGIVLVVVAAVVALLTTHPLAATTAASPTPSATAQTTQSRIPASSTARQQFVRSLQAGGSPGLLNYLYGHPSYLPGSVPTEGREDSTEYSGRGTSTIVLDPSELAERGGWVTVIVVTDRAATFSWRAERIAQANDRSGPVLTVASHAGSARAGEPVTSAFGYSHDAPARLSVSVDGTVTWGAVVVFTS